jgi:rubrerythrin
MSPPAATTDAAGPGSRAFPQAPAAGPVPALRCASCGYAIASYRAVPSCPMCHARRWIADRRVIPAHGRQRT